MASVAVISPRSIFEYTKNAAAVIEAIAPAAGGTFLTMAARLSRTIITEIEGLQTMKANQEQCIRIAEGVHHILVALTSVFATSESILDIKLLDEIGMFVGTLQRLYGSLRTQQELGKLKRMLKQGQITAQLKAYELELNSTLRTLTMHLSTSNTVKIVKLSDEIEARHQQLLELIALQSDKASTISSGKSLFSGSSSSILSLLPPQPQIMFGRETELEHVLRTLSSKGARLAILGAGGMGKTTLATTALHHPNVVERYSHRYFVSCESSNTAADLIALVGLQLGLEPSRQLSLSIVEHLQQHSSTLIVFDNLDTVWEPMAFRSEVEEFLSLLTDIADLAIAITMRGSERPSKVKWTRPFLPVLGALSTDASRGIFLEIADEPRPEEGADFFELLKLADNLPLAINLLAHLAASESYSAVLSRWKTENFNLISAGFDKGSSLDHSIMLSLTSPRMLSTPQALQLLALISLLPDGIHDDDLVKAQIPIAALAECRATLLRTSLAHRTPDNRLKALIPIREFMQSHHPVLDAVVQPLRKYFRALLSLWEKHRDSVLGATVTPHLNMNAANFYSLLQNQLQHQQQSELENAQVGLAILVFDFFTLKMLKGGTPLIDYVPKLVESTGDRTLYWEHFAWRLRTQKDLAPGEDFDALLGGAIQHFKEQDNQPKQVRFYVQGGDYQMRRGNVDKALELSQLAVSLAQGSETIEHVEALKLAAYLERGRGNYSKSLLCGQAIAQLSSTMGRVESEGVGLQIMASAYFRLGNLTGALDYCTRSRKLMEVLGLDGNTEYALSSFDLEALILFEKTEYLGAKRCLDHVLKLAGPHKFFHANTLQSLARLGIFMGADKDEIRAHLTLAHAICTELAWKIALHTNDQLRAKLALLEGDKMKAAAALERLLGTARHNPEHMLVSLEVLGDPMRELFGGEATFRWTVTYFALAMKVKFLGHIYQSLRCLGDVLLAHGDEETALQIFRAVLAGSTDMDVHQRRADCMFRIGDILAERGEMTEAKAMWEGARPLFVISSQVKDVTAINKRLGELAAADEEPVNAKEEQVAAGQLEA